MTDPTAHASIRMVSPGHAAFAVAMIALGVMGLATGDFAQIWSPAPAWLPARTAFVYLTAVISLAAGLGLLWPRTAFAAARTLLVALLAWLVATRLPSLFYESPLVLVAWTCGATACMAAPAWALYVRLSGAHGRSNATLANATGLRMARVLYGMSLIPFGLAHFMYLDATTVLIPSWLPWPVAWAYITGATFIAAGLAVALGVLPRLAAVLTTWQIGLFTVVVWVPRMITGNITAFQRGEFIASCVLTAGAWVMAESYRAVPPPP